MNEIYLSVVLPCYNLEKTIYQNTKRITEYLKKSGNTFEVIAINDGSLDDTSEELFRAQRDLGIQVITYTKNRGKGYAVRKGVAASRGEITGFLDADLSYRDWETDRKSTRLNSSHRSLSRMPSSA